MPQSLLPNADGTIGSWTDQGGGTSNLYQRVDESPDAANDTDYVRNVTDSSALRLEIPTPDTPGPDTQHVMRVRARGTTGTDTLATRVFQDGTLVASAGHTLTTSWALYEMTLSEAQAAAITDYSLVNLRLVVLAGGAEVSAVELRLPPAAIEPSSASAESSKNWEDPEVVHVVDLGADPVEAFAFVDVDAQVAHVVDLDADPVESSASPSTDAVVEVVETIAAAPVLASASFGSHLVLGAESADGDLDVDDIRLHRWQVTSPDTTWDRTLDPDEVEAPTTVDVLPTTEGTGALVFGLRGKVTGALSSGCSWVGSLEGGEALAGRVRRKVFGVRRRLEGALVDPQNLVWEVTAGEAERILPVIGGITAEPFGSGLVYDGDMDDVYGWTPVADHYVTDRRRGLVRMYSVPDKALAFDVWGAGVQRPREGDLLSTVDHVVRELCAEAGVVASGSIDDLARVAPYSLGVVTSADGETLLEDLLHEVAASLFGWWGLDPDGRVVLGLVDIVDGLTTVTGGGGSPIVLTSDDVASVRRVAETTAPPGVEVSWRPYEVVVPVGEGYSSLSPTEAQDVARQARIVYRRVAPIGRGTGSALELPTALDAKADAVAVANRAGAVLRLEGDAWDVDLGVGSLHSRRWSTGDRILLRIEEEPDVNGRTFTVCGTSWSGETDSVILHARGSSRGD